MVNQNIKETCSKIRLELIKESKKDLDKLLLEIYVPEKGIPTDIKEYLKEREQYNKYDSSCFSTMIVAFHNMDLLTIEMKEKFYETLFLMRDRTSDQNQTIHKKREEDRWAWSTLEGPNVFSTSWAIWALLETGYNGKRLDEVRNSIFWLKSQQRKDGGFGYYINCESEIFFTALTTHSLKLAQKSSNLISENEKIDLSKITKKAINYILDAKNEDDQIAFWKKDLKPDPTYTLYALWALYEENKHIYKGTIEKGIEFLRKELNDKEIWDLKEIVAVINEVPYGIHKVFYSFTPSFPLILLRLGIKPLDSLCLKPLLWMKNNKKEEGWSLDPYYKNPVSFCTVLGLWTIYEWEKNIVKSAISENFAQLYGKHVLKEIENNENEKLIKEKEELKNKVNKLEKEKDKLHIVTFISLFILGLIIYNYKDEIINSVQNILNDLNTYTVGFLKITDILGGIVTIGTIIVAIRTIIKRLP